MKVPQPFGFKASELSGQSLRFELLFRAIWIKPRKRWLCSGQTCVLLCELQFFWFCQRLHPLGKESGTFCWWSNDWRNDNYDIRDSWWNRAKQKEEAMGVVCLRCDTRNLWSKAECKFCEASWDWWSEFDSDSNRDSDNDICPGGQNRQAKRKASGENVCATDLHAKEIELEEKARCGASFNTTCVRSTEYYKLADDGPSENGRPTEEEEVQK